MNYLYLLTVIEIILLLFVIKFTRTDFTSPSFITVLMFFLSTLCIIWNEDYWEVEFKAKTCMVVAVGLVLIVFMEFLIKNMTGKRRRVWIDQNEFISYGSVHFDFWIKILFVVVTTVMSGIYVLLVIRAGGVSLSNAISAISIVHADDEVSVGTVGTICVRMMRLITFPCLFYFVYNVFVCKDKFSKNIWLLVSIVESFVVIFFTGVRSTYLYFILAAFFYVIMLQRFKKGWREVELRKYIKYLVIFGVLFIGIFLGSRTIVKGHEFTSTGLEYITFYLGSPLHLFNKIIDDTTMAFPTHYTNIFGAHTFRWFYQELYKFGLIDTLVEATNFTYVGGGFYGGGNVYTMFAYTLHDFGYVGMYIVIMLLYYVFDYFYYKKIKYCKYICNKMTTLMVYGSFYYIIFMTFYGILISQLKLQTILETAIMILVFKYLPRIRLKVR